MKEMHSSKERGAPRLSVDRLSETISLQGERAVSGYTVETLYAQPEEPALRRANGDDPEYMEEMYLELPEELPSRVKDLAQKITSDAAGRYETAQAIESYLEQNYTYTLQTSVPPEGRDFTDHFCSMRRKGTAFILPRR